MSEKPEAIRLAERFEEVLGPSKTTKELRRLCEVNLELINALREIEWTDNFDWAKDRAKAALLLAKARGEG